MKRREIILVSVAAVAAFYALYALLFDHPSRRSNDAAVYHRVAEAQDLVVQSAAVLADTERETVNSYVISLVEREWIRDPFSHPGDAGEQFETVRREDVSLKESASVAEGRGTEILFLYSGYLEAGKARIAVINDCDYEVGEEIESTKYVVRHITPKKVTVQNRHTKESMVVPFAGE